MTQTTPEQRQRLRELHAATTQGKWSADVGCLQCFDEDYDIWFAHGPQRKVVGYEPGKAAVKADADFMSASHELVPAILADLDAAEAEIGRLKEESVELHEMILLAEGFHIRDGEMAGWIDSCCMTDAVLSGERLVELGIYERHPNRAGRRSFYRRKDAPARTALENNP